MPVSQSRGGSTRAQWLIVLAITAALAAMLVPNFVRARRQRSGTACFSNLRNIATGLEIYSSDWGVYPPSLDVLTPNYLKTLPECPPAGKNTYSGSFKMIRDKTQCTLICPEHRSDKPNQKCADGISALYGLLIEHKTRNGAFPEDLSKFAVSDKQLRCPATDGKHPRYDYRPYVETYFICCQGDNHTAIGIPPDHPAYDGVRGLIER